MVDAPTKKAAAGGRAPGVSSEKARLAGGASRTGTVRRQPSAKQLERQRRQAEARRRLCWRIAVVLGAAVALWAAWSLLVGSQMFEIKRVEVVGTSVLSTDDVIARAAVDEGETLLRVDREAIVGRLLEDPWVEDATIHRRLPSTLRIDVTERTPAAIVDTGVSFWFVEQSGRVIAESVPSSATVAPVIRDVPDFVAEPGKLSDSAALRNALEVLAGLSDDLRSTVRSVTAPSVDETALLTTSGVEIMVGEAVKMEQKSIIIADILTAKGADVVFIDVRSTERPISRGLGD